MTIIKKKIAKTEKQKAPLYAKTKLYRLVLSWCGGEGEYEGQQMPLYTSDLCLAKDMCVQLVLNDPKQFLELAWEIRCHIVNNWKDVPPHRDGFTQAMKRLQKYPKVQQFVQSIRAFLPKMIKKNEVVLSNELKGFRVLPDCLQLHWEQFFLCASEIHVNVPNPRQ